MNSLDDIFLTAREIANPAERAAYLAKACGDDAALRARVETMLRHAEGAEKFFGAKGTVIVGPPEISTEGPGTVIGRYKLLQKIGEGGMGVVYMAEQREPVARKVALKIIKLGMDTRQVVARFETERQALALMDDPNIAKVFDGGETEAGRPYFVMELVQGLPITQFCDEANLSTHDRLRLFLEVCSAIQHAHQKGIIHRDIKPSNILVTLHGDKPVPKVIDFGVVKATQGRLTEKTLFTEFQQFIGTPAYMSPEQASLSGLDIDTRSDIYALGVLLYELLTGRTPFDGKELLKAGLDEMRRTIQEKQPLRPSNRIRTLQGEDLITTAKQRHTDAPKLIHVVGGDLDWIVMKCLEKDRTRRYETANGIAADIQRHLKCEPVVARPPSKLYEFQKTVRRHKFGFAAAAGVIMVLAAGVVASTSEAIRARRAEREQTQLRQVAEVARASEAKLRRQLEVRLILAQAITLSNSRKYDEAEKLLNGIDPSLIEPDAKADLRRQFAWQNILKNQWSGAVANLAALLQVDGEAWSHQIAGDYYLYGTALVVSGDQAGYEQFRQALVKRNLGCTDPSGADFFCLMALLTPADEKLMADLGPLNEVTARPQKFRADRLEDDMSVNYLHRALFDYRRGDFAGADELIQHCGGRLKDPTIVPTALVIRAMIHHQMHLEEEAQRELESARLAIGPVMKIGPSAFDARPSDQQGRYYEWVQASIFLREAEALIEGQTNVPTAGNSSTNSAAH